jgi:hypothetical protein
LLPQEKNQSGCFAIQLWQTNAQACMRLDRSLFEGVFIRLGLRSPQWADLGPYLWQPYQGIVVISSHDLVRL